MIRLFVALELPPTIRDGLLAAMGGVAGARWQRDDQLHLTLRYIGEVDRHRAADIAATLNSVNIPPFSLSLATPGVFDKRGRIDSLWVGVTPRAEVVALARRVDGFPLLPLPGAAFPVTGFALFESLLSRDGSDYRILARYGRC